MKPTKKARQFSTTHIVGAAAAVLGVLFVVAFGAKVLEAIRLRNWRDRLTVEVQQLEREYADWEQQAARSASDASLEMELLESGWVRDDLVAVVVVTATPAAATPAAEPNSGEVLLPAASTGTRLFRNENWEAWRRLIRGFD